MSTPTQIDIRRHSAEQLARKLVDVESIVRIIQFNAEAIELLRETQNELASLIFEVNELRMAKPKPEQAVLRSDSTLVKIEGFLKRGVQ